MSAGTSLFGDFPGVEAGVAPPFPLGVTGALPCFAAFAGGSFAAGGAARFLFAGGGASSSWRVHHRGSETQTAQFAGG